MRSGQAGQSLNNITINETPIGAFESGVGGLSVLRAVRQALPNENLLYVAESRYAPYGNPWPWGRPIWHNLGN